MPRTLQDIATEALDLSPEARGELVAKLLDSLEPSETEVQAQWIQEAESRAESLRNGHVVGEAVTEVIARLRATLG